MAAVHITHSRTVCQVQWRLTQAPRRKIVTLRAALLGQLRRGLLAATSWQGRCREGPKGGLAAMALVGLRKPQGYAGVRELQVRMHHWPAKALFRNLKAMAWRLWLLAVLMRACMLWA